MASLHSLSLLHNPLFLSLPSKPATLSFPKLPLSFLKFPSQSPFLPRATPNAQNDAVLEILSRFDGSDNKALPAVRTYENELTRLTLVGAVDFDQALVAAAADGGEAAEEHIVNGSRAMVVETVFPGGGDDKSTVSTRLALVAAAADGGEAAEEHIVNGSRAMVVETVFPGGGDDKSTVSTRLALVAAAADGGEAAEEHIVNGSRAMVVETVFPGGGDDKSTVSTRLFMPASKVKEKANKLKSILSDDILSSTSSQNILAMTFRQVVLEQLWNWEMLIFRPGMQRNMKDLMKPREVPPSFTLSSSDELPISVLAEVVCLAALESTERHFRDKSLGRGYANFFNFLRKPERISSKDRSVIIHVLVEDELVRNAQILLEKFNFEKANLKLMGTNPNYNWWTLSALSELTKIGGPEFSTWVSEYVPAYKLQIDHNKVRNLKFDGWKNTSDDWWEVLLTHSQMVGLANILDMYYEDLYTLPNKELSCGSIIKATDLSVSKGQISFLKILSTVVLVSALSLVTISTTGQLRLPNLQNGRMYLRDHKSLQASDTKYIHQQSVVFAKLADLATSIVATVKETYGWPGDVMKQSDGAAWIGELPEYYRSMIEADYQGVDNTSVSASTEKIDDEMKALTQDIASYQVILSVDGKIIGIQPTSTFAVNHWATNSLAKELYVGKNLLPGLPGPTPETIGPTEMVVLDLFTSVNTDSCFALARPTKLRLPG